MNNNPTTDCKYCEGKGSYEWRPCETCDYFDKICNKCDGTGKQEQICKCISSNQPQDYQTDKSINANLYHYFPEFKNGDDTKIKKVFLDSCIADVIIHLWENKILTHGSCCSHNGHFPRMINLEDNTTKEEADNVRALIKQIDDREFELYSWTQTKI